jgi:hypothetical protein
MISIVLLAAAVAAHPAELPIAPAVATAAVRHGPATPKISGDHAVLPLTFTSGLPTMLVMVDGKGPFKIGFDTGAPGGPHMTDRLAEALGLSPVGESLMSDPSGKNPVTVKMYDFGRIVFDTVTVEGWVGTAAHRRAGKLESLDGIVGLDAFAGYIVTIDYRAQQIQLDRGALPPADGRKVFSYPKAIPMVPLTIEGHAIKAHLDTGNVNSVIGVPERYAAGLAHKSEAKPAGVAHTVSTTFDVFSMPIDGGAHVGDITLDVGEVRYPAVTDTANIGSLALTGMILRVDPANRRITIEPSSP